MPTKAVDIRVIERGRPIEETIRVFEGKIPDNKKLTTIRDKILNRLRVYIEDNRARNTEEHPKVEGKTVRFTQKNNLFNTIKDGTEILNPEPYKYILGIGERRFLTLHAPYWYVVNYGGYTPPPTVGYFGQGKPPFARGTDVFHYTGSFKGTNPYTRSKRSFYMVPKRPIAGMYYLNEMARVFDEEMIKLNQEFHQNR